MSHPTLIFQSTSASIRALVTALLLLCAGCNVSGALAYKFLGPPPVEALYTPPAEPMIVLVERYGATGEMALEGETLAREIYRDLREHNVAIQLDPMLAMDLRSRDKDKFKKMTISQIGAAVGARQVLYVNLVGYMHGSVDGGSVMQASMNARVKVIDVATGQLLWPVDAAEGHPVKADMPITSTGRDNSAAGFRADMMRSMASAVGKLFYKWQPEDLSPDFD